MRFAFRADASSAIGSGHVVRCAALADELKLRGEQTVFFCREAPGHLCDWLEAKGHEVRRLPDAEASPAQEIEQMQAALGGERFDWLMVDHYSLDADWERAVAPAFGARCAIDDIGRRHDCEVLLDQNVLDDDNAYRDRTPHGCRRLLGPRYALLRAGFAAARGIRRYSGRMEHVLIGFGGADPGGETAKAIEGFIAGTPEGIQASVVLGKSNPHRDALMQHYARHPRLQLIEYCEDMPGLMASCDLAIGAGGISTWERACLGLPSIVTAIAENQRLIAESVARRGGQVYLGTRPTTADYADALRLLSSNAWLRESCARIAARLCDGRGCGRVAAALLPLALDLRHARLDDAKNLLAWRNAEINRLPSFDPTPIALDRHLAWLQATLADPRRVLLIGADRDAAVGVLRYDINDTEAEVSIYLVPGCHGQGRGEQLLRAGTHWLRLNRPGVARLKARIKADNRRSQSVFCAAGYVREAAEFVLNVN
ncbi:MAG: UDP-2,4-diacetamido-2,4,6-trideoxy-beta-L-altropyranose hydrolase [Rhodocyclaceae bacterium]|nr:UDP-2,4-diacetamido-2,4,6-trideoxy-beta-L-altropyranose hydrolase [Rhodocyclaceae bacterium]